MFDSHSTLDLTKQAFKFSAAHFTIFSATERVRLHGHDFFVSCRLTGTVGRAGLLDDYVPFKRRIQALCDGLDELVLLPAQSPYLELSREPGYVVATFAGRRMPFLEDEVRVLPVSNVSLEELARFCLRELAGDGRELFARGVLELVVGVEAGPGQRASCALTPRPGAS